jgi:transcriptional regulator with XRE-family HTH domain
MHNKEEFLKELGKNIRDERMRKSFTIEALALESGLTYSQVSRIELGKRNATAYTLYILSQTLEVCPSDFFKSIKDKLETRNQSNGV